MKDQTALAGSAISMQGGLARAAPEDGGDLRAGRGAEERGERDADEGQDGLEAAHKAREEFVGGHAQHRRHQHHLERAHRQALHANTGTPSMCLSHQQWSMETSNPVAHKMHSGMSMSRPCRRHLTLQHAQVSTLTMQRQACMCIGMTSYVLASCTYWGMRWAWATSLPCRPSRVKIKPRAAVHIIQASLGVCQHLREGART